MSNAFDFDRPGTGADKTQSGGSRVRKIDDAIRFEWAPIVDSNDDALPAANTGHSHIAWQRQRRMRGGHREHVVDLAARGSVAVKLLAVPRCQPALAKRNIGRQRRVTAAQRNVRPIGAREEWLDPRHRIGSRRNVARRPIRRPVVLVVAATLGSGAATQDKCRNHKHATAATYAVT